MRVAALYDIHGNVHALEAVLEEVEREGVGAIVIGGDVAWGPFPSETIDILWGLDGIEFVRGNADREVGDRLGIEDGLDLAVAAVSEWCADQLTIEQREWLSGLPTSATLDIDGLGPTLFIHGSPRSDEEVLTHLTPEPRLRAALSVADEDLIVCGHTHMQFERELDGKRLVNAGSVGLPYQGQRGAFWALFGPKATHRRMEYDVQSAIAAMRRAECPHVESMFIDPLLNPPTADETAKQFEPEA